MCVVSQYIIVSDLHGYELQYESHLLRTARKGFTRYTKTPCGHGNGWKVACTDSAKACMKFPKNANWILKDFI